MSKCAQNEQKISIPFSKRSISLNDYGLSLNAPQFSFIQTEML